MAILVGTNPLINRKSSASAQLLVFPSKVSLSRTQHKICSKMDNDFFFYRVQIKLCVEQLFVHSVRPNKHTGGDEVEYYLYDFWEQCCEFAL